jgi:hypothetical protein
MAAEMQIAFRTTEGDSRIHFHDRIAALGRQDSNLQLPD